MSDRFGASASGLAGRSVIVTGAASGLGRAAALAFGSAGADVLLCDVDAGGLDGVKDALGDATGRVAVLPANLTEADSCAAIVAHAIATFGKLDALVNVAGVFHLNPVASTTPEAWDRVFSVNVRAPFLLAQAAMPHLIETDGAIVNVASSSALFGHAYLTAYGASKAALVSLTKSLAMEFMHTGVRINAIAPGGMATPMTLGLTGLPEGIDRSLMTRYGGLRGMNAPEDLVDLILYLASPANQVIHGTCVAADRGISAG